MGEILGITLTAGFFLFIVVASSKPLLRALGLRHPGSSRREGGGGGAAGAGVREPRRPAPSSGTAAAAAVPEVGESSLAA